MTYKKSKLFPIVLTAIIIFIIVYLFVSVEQPFIVCDKTTTTDLDITIVEDLQVKLDGRKIKEMELTKTIILPAEYLDSDTNYLKSIRYAIRRSYSYLDKSKITYKTEADRLIVKVTVSDNETIILNNIAFTNTDSLQIKINSNTKSSEVVTLKVSDNYTEGELMTHLKNNGYTCK